jgi:hypothetical protein
VGLERAGSSVGLPEKPQKKTSRTVYFTYMGSRDPPADYYELLPTWWCRRFYQSFNFLLRSVKGFLFCEVLKIVISYT